MCPGKQGTLERSMLQWPSRWIHGPAGLGPVTYRAGSRVGKSPSESYLMECNAGTSK